ncbi:MAG: hypothetical protein H8E42_06900 [Nitrospinae bacterium]|nr:hypothetical protein [Nitrospinota bacterium]MBL7018896.1 hypothetical protein [Nitrospinaceae bacterium]
MSAFTSQSSPASKSGFFGLFNGSKNGLLKSESGLLSCLDNVQANVLVADKEFNLTYANDSAVNTLSAHQGSDL